MYVRMVLLCVHAYEVVHWQRVELLLLSLKKYIVQDPIETVDSESAVFDVIYWREKYFVNRHGGGGGGGA